MNILLFCKEQFEGKHVSINNAEKIQHVHNILQAKIGDTIKVGEVNGLLGNAKIIELSETRLLLEPNLFQEAPPALPCTVILALPRPQQFKRILVHVASLGIKKIVLIQSARVEKNYWQSPKLYNEEIENYLIEGLEQAQDTVLPTVEMYKHWPSFIKNDLPTLITNREAWLAQPGNFPYCPSSPEGEHVLIVGPEGGFLDDEVQQLRAAGCKAVSIGQRILKVETAIPVLVSRLFALP
jgi:16S rRNA (uracil1498-N3)-methyltransferase